jgi:hypothetical protein
MTLRPEDIDRPTNIGEVFHLDKVQALVSRYASDPFEVAIGYGVRDGRDYPVLCIPEGVRFPVAAKRDLKNSSGRYLIREGDVYFRTLDANGTPSTAKARPRDWQEIMDICFENREADIGRFLRRHLQGISSEHLRVPPTLRERARAVLDDGEKRLQVGIEQRDLSPAQGALLKRGAWSVALVIDPPRSDARPDKKFLSTFGAAKPNYTGWPVWLDSSGFVEHAARPVVVDRAWQSLIISLGETWSRHVDFMRIDPKGEFYLWRLLQDDLSDKVKPNEVLDVILVIIQVAEAIAVGLKVARTLGWQAGAQAGFAFRWTGLRGRELGSWANPMVSIMPWHKAEDDAVDTFVQLSLDTADSAIAPFVEQATADLFVIFSGYSLPSDAFEHWVKRLLERRL